MLKFLVVTQDSGLAEEIINYLKVNSEYLAEVLHVPKFSCYIKYRSLGLDYVCSNLCIDETQVLDKSWNFSNLARYDFSRISIFSTEDFRQVENHLKMLKEDFRRSVRIGSRGKKLTSISGSVVFLRKAFNVSI